MQINAHTFPNETDFGSFQFEDKHMLVSDKLEIEAADAKMLHPSCRALFRYWETLREERPCPRKDDIDLRQIQNLMPYLSIIERNSLSAAWQFRLAGTKLGTLFGREMTGMDVMFGWDSFERNVVSNCLDITLERLQPSLVRMRFISDRGDVIAAEMIGLPVQNGKRAPVQIFGGLFPFLDEKPAKPFNSQRRELVSARMIWTEHESGDNLMQLVGRKAQVPFQVIQGGLR
jgi:hypothetical protein